jgi:hypothetical protein
VVLRRCPKLRGVRVRHNQLGEQGVMLLVESALHSRLLGELEL